MVNITVKGHKAKNNRNIKDVIEIHTANDRTTCGDDMTIRARNVRDTIVLSLNEIDWIHIDIKRDE